MAKGKNKLKAIADKNARKAAKMKQPGDKSNYAKKAKYWDKHNVFGFDVPEPKPWKSK